MLCSFRIRSIPRITPTYFRSGKHEPDAMRVYVTGYHIASYWLRIRISKCRKQPLVLLVERKSQCDKTLISHVFRIISQVHHAGFLHVLHRTVKISSNVRNSKVKPCCFSRRLHLWSSGHGSWLHNGDVLCFLWGTNWIYMLCRRK
jgi:hypothetical protein